MKHKKQFEITWHDYHREPEYPANPNFPRGKIVDCAPGRKGKDRPICLTDLPYPAKRCGTYIIRCKICGLRVGVTTAGRADDPRAAVLPCKVKAIAPPFSEGVQ